MVCVIAWWFTWVCVICPCRFFKAVHQPSKVIGLPGSPHRDWPHGVRTLQWLIRSGWLRHSLVPYLANVCAHGLCPVNPGSSLILKNWLVAFSGLVGLGDCVIACALSWKCMCSWTVSFILSTLNPAWSWEIETLVRGCVCNYLSFCLGVVEIHKSKLFELFFNY